MEQEDRKVGRFEDGTEQVIGALIEVHRTLGPGLLESAYEACVCAELSLRGMRVARQQLLPVEYKGVIVLKTALRRLTPEHPNSFRSSDLPVPTKSTIEGPAW
jgi:hypothetical protein